MKYFAGLEVSFEWTNERVVDGDRRIVREAKVPSEPDALAAFFAELEVDMTRIALEAGPLSHWLHDGLAKVGLPVVCTETQQLKAVLSATVNKSARNDACGIAQIVRVDMNRPMHVKTLSSQVRRVSRRDRRRKAARSLDGRPTAQTPRRESHRRDEAGGVTGPARAEARAGGGLRA